MSDTPESLSPIPPIIHHGLLAVSVTAALSLITTAALTLYLSYRILIIKTSAGSRVSRYAVLLLNLIFADLLQAIGFSFNIHWLRNNAIIAGSPACWSQGWFLTTGDVGSCIFTVFMAAHLFADVVFNRRPSLTVFRTTTAISWIVVILFASVGVAVHQSDFYMRAGMWCWINSKYIDDRLWLHYLWIIAAEFLVILLYTLMFFSMWRLVRQLFTSEDDDDELMRRAKFATRTILAYPIVYVVCTLPAVIGRLSLMAGRDVGYVELTVVGVTMCSNGWMDAVLYTFTRRSLFMERPPQRRDIPNLDPCDVHRTSICTDRDESTSKSHEHHVEIIDVQSERPSPVRQAIVDDRDREQRASCRSRDAWLGLRELDFDLGEMASSAKTLDD